MKTLRIAAATVASSLLLVAPVVTPAWSAPRPVAPLVHRQAIGGVDVASAASTPPAFDPANVRAAERAGAEPTARTTKSTQPTVLTRELDTGHFTAAGVTWSASAAPSNVVVQIRARESGTWSDWQPLPVAGGADPTSAEGRQASTHVTTEPYSTGSADAIQVRVDSPQGVPPDLQLLTVDPGSSPADANLSGNPAATAQGLSVRAPAIITRPHWGADETIRTCIPTAAATLKVGFVHHTVTSNSYTPQESAGIVRGIYAFHVQGNGWCDIGYNFLVDRYGQIFEGRYGSITQPIIGAHTLGFNTGSFGVAAIGTFSTVTPPAALVSSISNVLGWRLAQWGHDPRGAQTLVSAGGTGAKWPAGTVVTFNTVSGHRDAYATECPGNALYPYLGQIRGAAYQYAIRNSANALTLTAGQQLTSPSRTYRAVLQTDGNFVIYRSTGAAVWASGTFSPYSFLAVQGDGNSVIYDRTDGSARWASRTQAVGARMAMQDDGNLVVYNGDGQAIWDSKGNTRKAATTFPATKRAFGSLNPGQRIYTADGAYFIVMQGDGNLVEYTSAGKPRWASGTFTGLSRLAAQADGNYVIYAPNGRAVWATGTAGSASAFAAIHNDGRLTVNSTAGTLLWSR